MIRTESAISMGIDLSIRIDWDDPGFPVWASMNGKSPKITPFITRDFKDINHAATVIRKLFECKYGVKSASR